jgi:excinuclease ABC subunit C
LDDTVDTFEVADVEDLVYIILVSIRGRRPLGELVFVFHRQPNVPASSMLRDVIEQFYVHHLPRSIRVSEDFDGRSATSKILAARFGRPIKIEVVNDARPRISAIQAIEKAKERISLGLATITQTPADIREDLMRMFGLERPPFRLAAFDVAHISATGFAAAVSVWNDGKFLPDEYRHWISDRKSELETLTAFVAKRLTDESREVPDLILVDGGAAHLKAALKAKGRFETTIIAAVKPRGKHYSISHFVTEDGRRVEYDQDVQAFRVLHRLRDDAHDLANATHRLGRDMMHFYELAAILPSQSERERQSLLRELGSIRAVTSLGSEDIERRFGKKKGALVMKDLSEFATGRSKPPAPFIVPIRFVETDGAAEDLIPIDSR